jgi:CpeT protein
MKLKNITILALIIISFTIPIFAKETFKPSRDLKRLGEMMTGYFSSEDQAKADTDYFDIRLKMVRIWNNRTDGYWLYVEQAVADYEAKPYRQRVYRVSQIDNDLFESRIYKINEPLRFAGAWKDKFPLSNLTPDSLEYKKGTLIVLIAKDDSTFAGSTIGKECPSDLRGAKYATTDVIINEQGLDTWDRGYDENNLQVWGPTKAGYIFKLIEDYPLE